MFTFLFVLYLSTVMPTLSMAMCLAGAITVGIALFVALLACDASEEVMRDIHRECLKWFRRGCIALLLGALIPRSDSFWYTVVGLTVVDGVISSEQFDELSGEAAEWYHMIKDKYIDEGNKE